MNKLMTFFHRPVRSIIKLNAHTLDNDDDVLRTPAKSPFHRSLSDLFENGHCKESHAIVLIDCIEYLRKKPHRQRRSLKDDSVQIESTINVYRRILAGKRPKYNDPYVASTMLLRFLKYLSKPLMSHGVEWTRLKGSFECLDSQMSRVQFIRSIVDGLPPLYRANLEYVIRYLSNDALSKADQKSARMIARIFAPILIHAEDCRDTEIALIVEFMLLNCDAIFKKQNVSHLDTINPSLK